MSEVEFDRLLEAVRMAIEPAPQEDFLAHPPTFDEPPKAANDNQFFSPPFPFFPLLSARACWGGAGLSSPPPIISARH